MKQIKKFKSLLLALLLLLPGSIFAEIQETASRVSRFAVGIDNTRLVYGKYTYKDHFFAKLNVSVYSEKLGFQYARATLGYKIGVKDFRISGAYFFGSAFNGSYYNTGAVISGDALFVNRLMVNAMLAPWYDSGFSYKTCWQATVGCKITDFLNLKVGYTTIPEYRMSENRVLGILDFHVSHLSVSPYLTIGTDSEAGGKNLRMGFQFEYQF